MGYVFRTNDIVEMRGKGTIHGEPFEVVQHFRQQDDFKTAAVWADAMRAYFLNEFGAAMTPQAKWLAVSVRRVSGAFITPQETIPITPLPGGWSGEAMPHQVATLYKVRTAINLSQGKGRIYIPGVPVSWYQNGQWTNNAIVTMTSICSRLREWGTAGGFSFAKWGVWSRQFSPPLFTPMLEVKFSGQPVVQRGRRPVVS